MLEENLDVMLAGKLHDQAFRVVGITEIGCPADTRGHAHGKLPYFKPVQAKVALAGHSLRVTHVPLVSNSWHTRYWAGARTEKEVHREVFPFQQGLLLPLPSE